MKIRLKHFKLCKSLFPSEKGRKVFYLAETDEEWDRVLKAYEKFGTSITAHGNSGYITVNTRFEEDHRQFFSSRLGFYKRIIKELRRSNLSLATGESITGGLVSSALTSVPRASKCFKGGVVAYTITVKEQVLGISADFLFQHSDVSPETALQLAECARRRLLASVGLGTCGYASSHPRERKRGEFYWAISWGTGHMCGGNDEELDLPRRTVQRICADSVLWNLLKWLGGNCEGVLSV